MRGGGVGRQARHHGGQQVRGVVADRGHQPSHRVHRRRGRRLLATAGDVAAARGEVILLCSITQPSITWPPPGPGYSFKFS